MRVMYGITVLIAFWLTTGVQANFIYDLSVNVAQSVESDTGIKQAPLNGPYNVSTQLIRSGATLWFLPPNTDE